MMQHLKQTYTIKTFDVGPLANMIYIITDNKSKESAIIDPAWDMSEVYKYIGENDLILKKILLTHSHHDHVNAIDEILASYDLEIHINKKEKVFWKKEYDLYTLQAIRLVLLAII